MVRRELSENTLNAFEVQLNEAVDSHVKRYGMNVNDDQNLQLNVQKVAQEVVHKNSMVKEGMPLNFVFLVIVDGNIKALMDRNKA